MTLGPSAALIRAQVQSIREKARREDPRVFGFKAEGNNGVFDGGLTLKRTDFAIGEGPWADVSTVANEIQVNFHVVAAASAAPAAKTK